MDFLVKIAKLSYSGGIVVIAEMKEGLQHDIEILHTENLDISIWVTTNKKVGVTNIENTTLRCIEKFGMVRNISTTRAKETCIMNWRKGQKKLKNCLIE